MAWIKLDDQIAQHPKFLKAGVSAWMWVGCLGYAQRFLTDGFIPDEAIGSLLGEVPKPKAHINKLIRCRLLERVKGGYQIHDYLEHNDSKAVVLEKRRVISEVRAKAGKIGAMAKWQKRWQVASSLPASVASDLSTTVLPPSLPLPTKNPPTPLSAKGGRLTRKELAHARAVLGKRFGRCQHEPECANPEDCVKAIAADRKRR